MKAMSADQYDYIWDNKWEDMKKYGPMSRHIRRNIKALIRPLSFDSVLDVGCGQGSFLSELRTEFPHIKVSGTDISNSAIKLARKKVPDGEFWVLDMSKDYIDHQFDLLVCSEVLEHVPDDITMLRNMAQMSRRYLIVSTVQGRMRRFEPKEVGHVRNYGPGELVRKLEATGFRALKVVEWGFPFYSPLYRNFLDLTSGKGTTGEFGWKRRVVADLIYYLFLLNSSKRGDEIFVLAERLA